MKPRHPVYCISVVKTLAFCVEAPFPSPSILSFRLAALGGVEGDGKNNDSGDGVDVMEAGHKTELG